MKKRYWLCVIYPGESAPDNWREILENTRLAIAVSPLHDRDVNPDGEIKKPHRHVLLAFEGPTTFNAVRETIKDLNGPLPVPCESVRGAYRYLTHKDNPEKAQYDEKDVICLNGFNPGDYVELTKTEVTSVMKVIQTICRQNGFYRVNDLADYLLDNDFQTEYDVLTSHTYFVKCYLDGMYQKKAYGDFDETKKIETIREIDVISKNLCAARGRHKK